MEKMLVKFIGGLNGDRVDVKIFKNSQDPVFEKQYSYGYNASYNKELAKFAAMEHEKAKKNNWRGIYPLKPFIGDILIELMETYSIEKDNIDYSGFLVFPQRGMTIEEVQEKVNKIFSEI